MASDGGTKTGKKGKRAGTSEVDPVKDVKDKKSKKSKKTAKQEAEAMPVLGEKRKAEDDADMEAKRIAKKERKAKKYNKKELAAAAAAAEADTEPAEKSGTESIKLDKKSKKSVGREVKQAVTRYASVGNVELADASTPIHKDLYSEHSEVTAMTVDEVKAFQDARSIKVEGLATRPVTSFSHLGFDDALLHAVKNFQTPSPIQAQCWPIILQGRDLIGIASTGSGKTLAFGLPALLHIREQKKRGIVTGKGPHMVCMAPTRELATQIADVLQDSGSKCGIDTICIYGGVPKPPQISALRKGVQIVVGTPGRVCDLMQDSLLQLHEVTYLVLDEADRMLDMGFEPEIRKIVTPIRADRQTLMFSATWPTEIQRLAMEFLVKPVKVTIGSEDLAASHSVTQTVEVVDEYERNDKLIGLLQKHHKSRTNRILVFVLYKKEAPRVEQLLNRKGYKSVAVHGDLSQGQRTQAVNDFKSGAIPLLIATDVAARGLDIDNVEMVINYSFPLTVEDYVHRIGRTGRAGKTGIAHTFFVGANDKQRAGELVNVLREASQEVPAKLMSFGTGIKAKTSKLYGSHFKDIDPSLKSKKIKFGDDSSDDE